MLRFGGIPGCMYHFIGHGCRYYPNELNCIIASDYSRHPVIYWTNNRTYKYNTITRLVVHVHFEGTTEYNEQLPITMALSDITGDSLNSKQLMHKHMFRYRKYRTSHDYQLAKKAQYMHASEIRFGRWSWCYDHYE